MTGYKPRPLDTSRVELPKDLEELIEMLAQNTHENWAAKRMAEGWVYGEQRNDARKEHPDLVPYDQLPEQEKDVDRQTAREVLKAIILLGYVIERKVRP